MPRTIGHIPPDMTMTTRERTVERETIAAERKALDALRVIELEIREQANGESCGWLLHVANRMRDALLKL
jgi:hypothetical protein